MAAPEEDDPPWTRTPLTISEKEFLDKIKEFIEPFFKKMEESNKNFMKLLVDRIKKIADLEKLLLERELVTVKAQLEEETARCIKLEDELNKLKWKVSFMRELQQ